MELFQSPQKNFLRQKYQRTLLFYRFNQSVQSTIHVILNRCEVESFGGLCNSFMKIFVILARIRIFKSPICSCLNYEFKNYGLRSVILSILT